MKNISKLHITILLCMLLEFQFIAFFIWKTKQVLNNPKIEIYSVFHKDYPIYKNDVIIPIHAGRALHHDYGRPLLNKMIGDDTGDNISSKNDRYAELTVLYWMWKHSKADYVGLMHYRRSFIIDTSVFPEVNQHKFCHDYLCVLGVTHNNLKIMFQHYDIIAHEKVYLNTSISNHYRENHNSKDLSLAIRYISDKYPEMLSAMVEALRSHNFSNLNMFIMRKDILDAYCTWLFDVLSHIEPQLSNEDGYQKRVAGFLGERLWNIWLEYVTRGKFYRIVYVPVHDIGLRENMTSVIENKR